LKNDWLLGEVIAAAIAQNKFTDFDAEAKRKSTVPGRDSIMSSRRL
jgi:hypothetical protein